MSNTEIIEKIRRTILLLKWIKEDSNHLTQQKLEEFDTEYLDKKANQYKSLINLIEESLVVLNDTISNMKEDEDGDYHDSSGYYDDDDFGMYAGLVADGLMSPSHPKYPF